MCRESIARKDFLVPDHVVAVLVEDQAAIMICYNLDLLQISSQIITLKVAKHLEATFTA